MGPWRTDERCDHLWQGFVWVWYQGLVFFPVTSQFFLVEDIPGKGMDDNGVSLGDLSLGRRAFRENFSLHLLLFSSACSSKCRSVKAVYFEMMCPEILQSYFGVVYSAAFTVHELLLQKNRIDSSQWFKMTKNEEDAATHQVSPWHQVLYYVASLYCIISSPSNGSVGYPWV